MKNLISILLLVAVILAPLFLENAIYWQIFQFFWIAFYFGILANLDKNVFSNKDGYLSFGKFIWKGMICRILPLGIFVGVCGMFVYKYEFLLSTVIFLLIALALVIYTFIFALHVPIKDDDEDEN